MLKKVKRILKNLKDHVVWSATHQSPDFGLEPLPKPQEIKVTLDVHQLDLLQEGLVIVTLPDEMMERTMEIQDCFDEIAGGKKIKFAIVHESIKLNHFLEKIPEEFLETIGEKDTKEESGKQ